MAVVAVAHRLCRNLFAMLRDGTVFDVGKLAIGTPTHGVMRVFGPTGLGRGCRPFEAALRWLRTIPGVGQRIAENLLAEIGPEMAVFPSAGSNGSVTGSPSNPWRLEPNGIFVSGEPILRQQVRPQTETATPSAGTFRLS